jgi:kynurenine formamidase
MSTGPDARDVPDELIVARHATFRRASRSPFGPDDEIGMLNLMTDATRARIVAEADGAKMFNLAVDYFIGMPCWTYMGDPGFQIWMSHTPSGTVVEDPGRVGKEHNELVSYSGDCISMYTHCGTHIDSLNHFGYCGEIFNGYTEHEHLGSRHWTKNGTDKQPPIIARCVMIDVAAAKGVDVLPTSYPIGSDDLREALDRQGTSVLPGDVVMIRTGRMAYWPEPDRYALDEPGINREGAEFLTKAGAIVLGADNLALEHYPGQDADNWEVVHTYLLAEAGVPIMEVVNLQQLSAEEVYEFALFAPIMPIRGGTGAPAMPIAFPLRR